jgi:glycine/D-amino acid oxidase-like deaminating enzyme
MRDEAELVIIGAGIVGCSCAYYLAQKGWRNVVVLEQGPLFEAGGSSSHAPGLVFELNVSKTMCQLSRWSVELYSQLRLDGLPCFYPVGSLEIAYSPERWEDLKLKLGRALSWGLPAELIDPAEVRHKIPILNVERVHGTLHMPSDGIAKAVRAAEVMANAARDRGAEFHGRTPVTGMDVDDGRVRAVVTPAGRVRTPRVLLCAGIWGPRVGRLAGVPIPLTPVEHQYARTAPLAELAGETREVVHPILRHQDRSMYFRQHADCYGIGSYQHEPILVDPDDIRPHDQAADRPAVRPFSPGHFAKAYESALELFPCFRGVDLPYRINGLFSFTPDGNPLVGESQEVRGFWVAEAV